MTKTFKEVIAGIRTAIYGREVREDIAQMGEYVEQFASTATTKASEAASSASAAKSSQTAAKTSETSAGKSATAAAASASAAKTSETNSKTSETNAKTSETNSKTSETNAKTSETNAKTSETNAGKSASAAASSQSAAAGSASAAETSESNAASSASAAKTAETNAAASAKAASASQTAAATSEAKAAASEKNAGSSATKAASSQSAAADSAAAAKSSEDNASQSAASAASSATAAGESETATKSAAETATAQAEAAASSAGTASTSAEAAASSASAALKSQNAAAASATSAKASETVSKEYLDQVKTITLGAQGWYETPDTLAKAVPIGENGWWAVVGSTDTIWVWDSDTSAWKDTFTATELGDYYTRDQIDGKLAGKSNAEHTHLYAGSDSAGGKANSAKTADSVDWANVAGKPETFPPSGHNHDDRYYTESEVDTKLGAKANDDSVVKSGHVGDYSTDTAASMPSYMGSYSDANAFYNVISIRHRNGQSDGNLYGLLIRSGLTWNDSLHYRHQLYDNNAAVWNDERTLLDNDNIGQYALPLHGTADNALKVNNGDVLYKYVGGDFFSDIGGSLGVNGGNHTFLAAVRSDSIIQEDGFPCYSSGIAAGIGDTQMYLVGNYEYADAWIGGGNGNKINWRKAVAWKDDLGNYLPLGGGTMRGNLHFADIGDSGSSAGITFAGSTDGAGIYYQTTGADQGNLVLNLNDDSNCYLVIAKNGEFKSYFSPDDGAFHGNVYGRIVGGTPNTWIYSRGSGCVYSNNPSDGGFVHAVTQKTRNGAWGIGALNGNNALLFSYTSDDDYNSQNNRDAHLEMYPGDTGRIVTTGNISQFTAGNATAWNGVTMRNNHNTSDTWIPVYSNGYMDYVLKDEIAGLNGVAASGPNYVRFTDGTQICWNALGPVETATYYLWTYSQPFASTPIVVWSMQKDGDITMPGRSYIYRVNETQTGIYADNTGDCKYPMVAIGRWK